ncbi:conjugal transfer protein [Xenorhabdus entomophaga]
MKKLITVFILSIPLLTGCAQSKHFPSDVAGNPEPINNSQVIEHE